MAERGPHEDPETPVPFCRIGIYVNEDPETPMSGGWTT